MWSIDIPKEEIAALLKDRNINVRQAVMEYVDSVLYEHDLLDLEIDLQTDENLVRCTICGYWTEEPLESQACSDCNESLTLRKFDLSMRTAY